MQSRTIFTIDHAKLDKAELDILNFVEGWLPTFDRWSVTELAQKCRLFHSDAVAAVDMLILNGLLENADDDALMGRMVSIPREAQEWITENRETINSLYLMNDTDMFEPTEIADA
tara:strand:+ start:217 stop:561 length:345 start_codon:yes stop_codon:yes gene_type:complete